MVGQFLRWQVLVWFGIAAMTYALIAWVYAEETAFARRSVVTQGTVLDVQRGGVTYSHDGQSALEYSGRVRYRANGTDAVARMKVAGCTTTVCRPPSVGESVWVSYDPDRPGRAVLSPSSGLPEWPVPGPFVLILVAMGLIPLLAGVANLVWIWPVLRARPARCTWS
ncbi:DUF3592 domain-containing protein [Herbidospora sp. RD11066]